MTPGLRESFKGFWSRPNRKEAWLWAADQFEHETIHAIDDTDEWHFFNRLCWWSTNRTLNLRHARNQTKDL